MLDILREEVEKLELSAEEIKKDAIYLFENVPFNPGSYDDVVGGHYATPSGELKILQDKLLKGYQTWYLESRHLVNKHMPDAIKEFENPHLGIISGLKLSSGWFGIYDKSEYINKWSNIFSTQIGILPSIPSVAEIEEKSLRSIPTSSITNSEIDVASSNEIFLVHGHDAEMKLDVARTLGDLDLTPIILHEQPNKGRTIIEKFEDYSDVNFAVVLLSPDDKGCQESDHPNGAKPRARQNVIFELGFFIGKLGRSRVIALYRGNDIDIPSDYEGVVYLPYDSRGGWKLDLVTELSTCGYDIDMNKLKKR